MNKQDLKKTLIICYSYHHNNTLKITNVIADTMNAKVITLEEINNVDLTEYDLIGFGSGIDSGKHYKPLLSLAKNLSQVSHKPSFIFSTSATQGKRKVDKDHSTLRSILTTKGYTIIAEFSCKGFNTNSFLKHFGGMNKGKPDVNDLKDAKAFANDLKAYLALQETL
ncbi:MAG: flavodoxin family protein [Candidatus Izimaplasma sp.]|nr:flavodoxin family protein [Candidatus Izimaplasma bacterium]